MIRKKQINTVVERFAVEQSVGLSNEQVNLRIEQKLVNNTKQKTSKSYLKIFSENIFTFFNLLWLGIFVALLAVKSYVNLLFIVVILLNTFIAIFQEIRSKKTVEKLSMVTSPKTVVVRDGKNVEINADEVVLDDVLVLEIGNQIPTDAIILSGNVEVNESLLTGESKPVKKSTNNELFAGSFITSGKCYAKANKIGKDSYIQTLAKEAKKFKQPNSNLFRDLNKIIKYIGIIIIPIGVLTFLNCFLWSDQSGNLKLAIEKTCGSLTGMIPAGMFLLISVALAVGVIKLAQRKTLVQDIYSIEMLARSNVLCLDKTGTITDGTMTVKEVVTYNNNEQEISNVISTILSAQDTTNNTSLALEKFFGKQENYKVLFNVPFSSDRKFTACYLDEIGTVAFGASEYVNAKLTEEMKKDIKKATNEGYRVLVVAKSASKLATDNLPNNMECVAIIKIEDTIREDAAQTINWFNNNGVEIKIISGDDPETVSTIAKRVGVKNYDKFVNLEGKTIAEVQKLAKTYTVFGRVTPEQKHAIIKELKKEKVVAMTGDGVNDTLALKEADCSIAMAEGSEVARNISHLVLLDSKFSSLPTVVEEGRRVINNVQKSSTLFLMKTFLAITLSIILLACRIPYIFQTKNMFLLEFFVIGIPSFFLALLPNKKLIQGDFIPYVLKHSLPYGFVLLFNIVIVILLGEVGILTENANLGMYEVSTASTILLTLVGFINLIFLCMPFNKIKLSVCAFSLLGISIGAIFLPNIFGLYSFTKLVFRICLILILFSALVNVILSLITIRIRMKDKNDCI